MLDLGVFGSPILDFDLHMAGVVKIADSMEHFMVALRPANDKIIVTQENVWLNEEVRVQERFLSRYQRSDSNATLYCGLCSSV